MTITQRPSSERQALPPWQPNGASVEGTPDGVRLVDAGEF
jgi:hypothetical protein